MEWTLQQQGFDLCYDKRLYDRLAHEDAAAVRGHLQADLDYQRRLVRFIENHDEPRSAAAFGDRIQTAAALISTVPGLRFYFDGQLEGARFRPPVQLARWPDEPVDGFVKDLYDRLLRVTKHDLFHAGEWRLLDVSRAGDDSYRDLVAYRWRSGARLAVVAANVGWGTAQGLIDLSADLPDAAAFDFTDELTDASYRWNREPILSHGFYVKLERGRAHVLTVNVA
jgi:hypothetical protein